MHQLIIILPAAAIIVIALIFGRKAFKKHFVPDNFGIVEKGIYRSGQLYPIQIEKVIVKYGIKTIIHGHIPELSEKDKARFDDICAKYDTRTIPIIMPGDGRGEFTQYDEAVELLRNAANLPALVCCARGTHRTGAIIAGYRVLVQGWPESDALKEMENYRFRPRPHRYKGGEHPLLPHLRAYFQARKHSENKPYERK